MFYCNKLPIMYLVVGLARSEPGLRQEAASSLPELDSG